MSKKSIEKLRKMWKDLVFAKVTMVVANECDIVDISIYNNGIGVREDGFGIRPKTYDRIEKVPNEDWKNAVISYSKFYGFAEGIFFHNNNFNDLDLEIKTTLDFSTWLHHQGSYQVPEKGSLIAGIVVRTSKGRKFNRWFMCSPQLKLLMDLVFAEKVDRAEKELVEKLIGGAYPDIYWAIARLVLFDNVQAFVDELKEIRPAHPCFGEIFDQWGPCKIVVSWNGMRLPKNVAQFVHELSFNMDEPMWWEQFRRLASAQGLKHSHPEPGGLCIACMRTQEDK